MDPLIRLRGVSRSYDGGSIRALTDIDLDVRAGERVAITGASGSGKSTLLAVMCGMELPESGRVCFDGCEPAGAAAWTRLRLRRIGFVFQAFNLLPTLTALENVQIPMFGVVRGSAARRRRAAELLKRVGLEPRMQITPNRLSGGERQRVAIARSLANDPDVIFADEPTGNLDTHASREILTLLAGLQENRAQTLVIATHEPGIAEYVTRRIELADGRLSRELACTF